MKRSSSLPTSTTRAWSPTGPLRCPRAVNEVPVQAGTRGVSTCSRPIGGASLVGDGCGVISPLTSQGLGGGPVAERGVRVVTSPGALRALTWAANEARLRLVFLQLVHA
jgi:hypothetical protein